MDQQPRALGGAQELVAEALALGGAGDQAGQIGDDEGPIGVGARDAERWRESRERIVRDLRLCRRQPRDQRGLARIGEPDDADVGEELELQVQPPARPRTAEVGAARRLIGGRGEARVAAPAAGAAHHEHALSRRGEIPQQLAGVAVGDHRADRNAQDEIVAGRAGAVAAFTVQAPLRLVMTLVVVIEERAERGIRLEEHRAAVAPVAPVGTAARHELLTAEGDAAGAPVAAFDEDVDLVDEHLDARVAYRRWAGPEAAERGVKPGWWRCYSRGCGRGC